MTSKSTKSPGRIAQGGRPFGLTAWEMVGAFKLVDSEATQKARGKHWKVEAFLVRNIFKLGGIFFCILYFE